MKDTFGFSVDGNVKITDETGHVYLDKHNAVHPQNMARVISRALANEDNYYIHRIAFGNGGTQTNAAFTITYNPPNDGLPPDPRTWDSRLYQETYSEIIDEGNPTLNPNLGIDPGSAGPNAGTRPGGGADPSGDPASVVHVSGPGVHSNELGLTSEVVITAVLNPGEPLGQFANDNQAPAENTETDFTFDEIGLYTLGAPAIDSTGTQDVDVGNRTVTDDTGLTPNTLYDFIITVDGGTPTTISFTTPAAGGTGPNGEILYGDLIKAILTGDVNWNPAWTGSNPLPVGATLNMTNDGTFDPSIMPDQTFGYLRFYSNTSGVGSSIDLQPGTTNDLFDVSNAGTGLNPPIGSTIQAANDGQDAGVQNAPTNSSTERERLLTHIVFSPVLKSANRTLTITYTLTISVAQTT